MSGSEFAELGGLIEEKKFEFVIDCVFFFVDIVDAFVHFEFGHVKGKIVV